MKKVKTEVEFEEILKQVTPFIINLSKDAVGCVEFEDMQQILMIHTWETWQSYDASKGVQFFTYLYPSLRHRRAMEMRNRCAQRRDWRKEGGSLDAPVDAAKDETCTFTNFVADMNGSNDPVERLYGSEISRIVYGVVNKQSSEQARKAMLLLLDGYKQTQVAEECGCPQSLISYHLSKFRKELAAALVEEGYPEYVPFSFR